SGSELRDDMIVLDTESAEVTFTGIPSRPVPSLLRGFSAPVILESEASQEDQLFLARHDSDPFNRWQALQDVGMDLAVAAIGGTPWSAASIAALSQAMADTLASETLDDAFKALALSLPDESLIGRRIGQDIDPTKIRAMRQQLLTAVFEPLGRQMLAAYNSLASSDPYAPDPASTGRRSLRNKLLGLLVASEAAGAATLASQQYAGATNMTDRLAALAALVHASAPEAAGILADFRTRFGADPLVLDKWLAVTATAPRDGVIEDMAAILADPGFPKTNPNRLRALMGTFAMANPTQFTRADGAGFRFVADFVAE